MIVFPNAGNVSIYLLRVISDEDEIGNQIYRLSSYKEVVGIASSITSKEYYAAKETKVGMELKISIQCFLCDKSKYVYIPSEDTVLEISRTYQNGMWMELYCSSTSLKKEEILGWNQLISSN